MASTLPDPCGDSWTDFLQLTKGNLTKPDIWCKVGIFDIVNVVCEYTDKVYS